MCHAIEAARETGFEPILGVVGYQAHAVGQAMPPDVRVVLNPHWQEGIATSLKAALRVLDTSYPHVGAVCIGLADQPLMSAIAYQRLAHAYHQGAVLAAATYHGQRQNPVLIARALWPRMLALTGDQGARQLMQQLPVTDVPCEDVASPADIDTIADLEALTAAMALKP
jgi:molybdenum cofactor cytidylyltransferase